MFMLWACRNSDANAWPVAFLRLWHQAYLLKFSVETIIMEITPVDCWRMIIFVIYAVAGLDLLIC